MTIDNRIFVTPATPFALLGFVRVFLWVAGVSLTPEYETAVAAICLVIGLAVGAMTTALLFDDDIDLGTTKIGKGGKQ